MKKFIAAAAAVALVFAMSATAFAQESTESTSASEETTTTQADQGTDESESSTSEATTAPQQQTPSQDPTVQDPTVQEPVAQEPTVQSLTDGIVTEELAGAQLEAAQQSFESAKADLETELKNNGYNTSDMKVIGYYDVYPVDGNGEGRTVRFAITEQPGEGKTLVAFHEYAEGKWEVIYLKNLGNGEWEGAFGSFSNVILAIVDAPKSSDGSSSTSAKTGDNGAVAVITAAAATVA